LEKKMVEGDLKVQDLEEAWNTSMKSYLEVDPSNSAEGVLQDVHWSMGGFGYFPTYLLGNLYGAQICHQVGEALPDLEENIAAGNLIPLREWLGQHIHGKGKTVSAEELIEQISGKPLHSDYFLDYLKNKFTPLYDLS